MMFKIGNHNAKILGKENEPKVEIVNGVPKKCCQNQFNCPLMPDRCDIKNVIYQADVYDIPNDTVMSYYGLTENESLDHFYCRFYRPLACLLTTRISAFFHLIF